MVSSWGTPTRVRQLPPTGKTTGFPPVTVPSLIADQSDQGMLGAPAVSSSAEGVQTDAHAAKMNPEDSPVDHKAKVVFESGTLLGKRCKYTSIDTSEGEGSRTPRLRQPASPGVQRQQRVIWAVSVAFGVVIFVLVLVVLILVAQILLGPSSETPPTAPAPARMPPPPLQAPAETTPSYAAAPVVPTSVAAADEVTTTAGDTMSEDFDGLDETPPAPTTAPPKEEQLHDALPPGWQAYIDKSGRAYYHNDVTKQTQWIRPRNKASQASRLMKLTDTSCVIQIFLASGPKTARGKGWHAKRKEWSLEAPASGLRFRSSAVGHPEKELDKWLQNRTLLCRMVSDRGLLTASSQGKNAIISLANTWGYLLDAEKHTLQLWDGLVARLEYAETQGCHSYLWLGSLPDKVVRWIPGDELPEIKCKEEDEGFHVIKALAALVLFDTHQELNSLIYMDADTIPSNFTVRPDDYIALAPEADFIGTSNHHLPILMNAGVFILRNTPWGKQLMEQWWANRCGFADQGALWHSLFELWAREVPTFRYNPKMFSDYETARASALRVVTDATALRVTSGTKSCEGVCEQVYKSTGCLTNPILLPHVLVLPVVPAMYNGKYVLPLQHHLGTAQWVCHFDTSTTPDQCYAEDEDTFDVVEEATLLKIKDMKKCRSEAGERFGYGCDCNKLLSGKLHVKKR